MANRKRNANDDQISDDAAIKCKAMLIECIDINKQEQQEQYDSGLNLGSTLEKGSDSQCVDVPVKLSSSHKTLVCSFLFILICNLVCYFVSMLLFYFVCTVYIYYDNNKIIYVCVYTYIYIYVYVYIHIYICVCIYNSIYM